MTVEAAKAVKARMGLDTIKTNRHPHRTDLYAGRCHRRSRMDHVSLHNYQLIIYHPESLITYHRSIELTGGCDTNRFQLDPVPKSHT